MRRYDSEALRHEVIRLRAVEAASESVLDDDVRQIAMDAARECVQYALRQLRGIKFAECSEMSCNRIGRTIDALERAEQNLTTTSTVPSEPVSAPAS